MPHSSDLVQEISSAYLDYSLSVIISRALPNARDGLKPVQRRILYAMKSAGYTHDKPFKKSAGTVGDTLKNFHPHGNAPVYEAMVRMAQPFSMNIPLIQGQGNFGSLDGDPPAAERYTEARLAKIARYVLHEQDLAYVENEPNYDNSIMMPSVLPVRFANLLVNGASGIAVGMATNIPPHNLSEIIDASIYLLENPTATVDDLAQFVQGPDFPLAGTVCDPGQGIREYFRTGKGSFVLRGLYELSDTEIVIKSIPYQTNKARLVEGIAQLAKLGYEISDVRDESSDEGIRIVVELKRDADPKVVLNHIITKTQLQVAIHVNMLAVIDQQPVQLNLKTALEYFLQFREEVVINRTKARLESSLEQAHKLIGLALALYDIDKIIAIIKQSSDTKSAEQALMNIPWSRNHAEQFLKLLGSKCDDEHYHLSLEQVRAILDLRLQKLTKLEQDTLANQIKGLADEIATYSQLLHQRPVRVELIKQEFDEVKRLFTVPRMTSITHASSTLNDEDLIEDTEMIVTLSCSGYIKRTPASNYRLQHRGGKGKAGSKLHEDDLAKLLITATNHTKLLYFSDLGKVFMGKVYQLPIAPAKGRPIINILNLSKQEQITSITVFSAKDHRSIVFITQDGKVRRNAIASFAKIQITGKRAMGGEYILVDALVVQDSAHLLLVTKHGKAIRFTVNSLRIMQSRESAGVTGITLKKQDQVISAVCIDNDSGYILTISEYGYGKLTPVTEYRCANRAGLGVATMRISKKTGTVLQSRFVELSDQLILISRQGQVIKINCSDIRIASRDTQGVMLVRLNENDTLVNATIQNEDNATADVKDTETEQQYTESDTYHVNE